MPGLCESAPHTPGAVSYGSNESNTYRLTDLVSEGFRSRFTVWHEQTKLGDVVLGIPGAHNAVNALAAIALATEIGVPFDKIVPALESFRGAKRRFEIRYESALNLVVDDYGHHPRRSPQPSPRLAEQAGSACSSCSSRTATRGRWR